MEASGTQSRWRIELAQPSLRQKTTERTQDASTTHFHIETDDTEWHNGSDQVPCNIDTKSPHQCNERMMRSFMCMSFQILQGDTLIMQYGISFFLHNAGNQQNISMYNDHEIPEQFPSIAASVPCASQACICSRVSATNSHRSCRSPD